MIQRIFLALGVALVLTTLPSTAGQPAPAPAPAQAASLADASVSSAPFSTLSFRTIGPATMSGRIVDLAVVEADPTTFYAASATGGLWKTMDNGVTFAPVFEREAVHSIGAIAIHQPTPAVVWVGTGEAANRQSVSWGDGVYKSIDAGKSWIHVGLRDTKHIGRIALHPTNADIVFVAAVGHLWGPNRERGVFKSIDGGKTWTHVLFVDNDTGATDVAIDPSDPSVMYAATYQRRRRAWGFHGGGPGSSLYKSTDGGETWTKLTRDLPAGDKGRIGIAIYRKDPRIVYVCIEQGVRYNASTAYGERLAGIYRSPDKGETWQHMSTWNPRPMYASQIRVDPANDQRIYMMNSFSYSDDGGKTFTTPRQSLHGDDRVVWINPRDSRHLIKGDDGGIGVSYDKGARWLYVSSLPVSQFYRISADMRSPFWVYGGLQDNGSWAGPSATDDASGVLNDHWIRTGGGDGFFNVIDPSDNRTLYTASQYLGLSRLDLVSFERTDIRPGNDRGFIGPRRNWETWGRPDAPEPELGNTMAPANWDAPIVLSPHDANTIYAGTDTLWKSTNRGQSWTSLGKRTTTVDRRTLRIMTQLPTETTLSLDDGAPYYPTITAIAESPKRRGLLYVGTDDGQLQVSRDEGRTWITVSNRIPQLPRDAWIGGIEASRHAENTVYVAIDNHRSDDYANYLYRSTDAGSTWTSIVGNLPANRTIRTVREDPRNPLVLYAGTELGLFVTRDGGAHWVELLNNLPRVAVNDLLIHPRDNDLVLATHGRGIWILDNVAPLQELTPAVQAKAAHLFTIEPAEMTRLRRTKAHAGDMIFRGQNPPAGAIIDYALSAPDEKAAIVVVDASGAEVAHLTPARTRGVHRLVWNLRYDDLPRAGRASEDDEGDGESGRVPGPLVVPGTYTVRLTAGGETATRTVDIREDPRVRATADARRAWTETLLKLASLYRTSARLADAARALPETAVGRLDTIRMATELRSRVATLYTAASGVIAPLTQDQQKQLAFFESTAQSVEAAVAGKP